MAILSVRPFHLITAVALIVLATWLQAQPMPSIPSMKADKSLLLDVARAGKRLVAVGERGHIILSDDEGRSWRQAKVPTRALLTAVYFPVPEIGFAVGHDTTILTTHDKGETWAIQHVREFSGNDFSQEEESNLPSDDVYFDEDYGEDGSESAREVTSREGVPLLDVWFIDAQRGFAVGAYGLMMRTIDGGKTWVDFSEKIPNPDGWHLNAITGIPGSEKIIFLAGEKGTAYRSLDSGDSFVALRTPSEGSFFGLHATREVLYAFGLQGKVLRSSNRGESWQELGSGITSGLNDACLSKNGFVSITGNAGVILIAENDFSQLTGHARADRQSILSCVDTPAGLLLVGEGGVKFNDLSVRPH